MENNQKLPAIDDGKYIAIGIFALVIVFGVIGLWSALAPMDSGVMISGQVEVEANNKIIQHLEGGIVDKINVKDGDKVKQGDVLIELSRTQAQSSLLSLQANYYETLALENRLIAENENMSSINFSDELQSIPDQMREKLINAQIDIFTNNKSSFEKNKQIASQKIESLREQIKSLQENIAIKLNLKNSYEEEAAEQQDLLKENLIDKTQLREVQRKVQSLESEILTAQTEIQKANIQINEIQTQLLLSEEDVFRKVKDELRKSQTALADMKAKMLAITDMLHRTSIVAPVEGTVLNLKVHTLGAVIPAGEPIMEIVPKGSKLIIQAQLDPQYIDYAKVGLGAKMRFPAFQMKGKMIEDITGEVIFVSADSVRDSEGISYYIVKLIINEHGKEVLSRNDLVVVAGMPVTVTLLIGSQTPLEYLLKPLAMMLEKAFLEE
ncbi:HlyD family type I secretion periplasmic adaptor subunit [Ectothiorhodospiraceae bacterium BW-2]|nr:HlyD family type I secretion periplasmic adaptor subunit [Ectothiorhodospiraceae bacterium BW-2]